METIWKNKLQEYCQKYVLRLPKYDAIDNGVHDPPVRWDSYCTLVLASGEVIREKSETPSPSKRDAEQKAARNVYMKLPGVATEMMGNLNLHPTTPYAVPTTPPHYPPTQPPIHYQPPRSPFEPAVKSPSPSPNLFPYYPPPLPEPHFTAQPTPTTPTPTPTSTPTKPSSTSQEARPSSALPKRVEVVQALDQSKPTSTHTPAPTPASKITSRGSARARLQKALAEEGLMEPIFVYQCVVYLPNGQSYRSEEYSDPKRAEDEAAQRAFDAFVSS
eukprot:TRINITY_DN1082_c0_g1_i1.p1 TRINITY_DN1082_c0_g1~~TRINITY_DN1082_c0_g1_i1.p1  ORF type:complete len:274 (-),score=59.63 TRINITY_DN1082_c0_g1_i1:313-1134(-)